MFKTILAIFVFLLIGCDIVDGPAMCGCDIPNPHPKDSMQNIKGNDSLLLE